MQIWITCVKRDTILCVHTYIVKIINLNAVCHIKNLYSLFVCKLELGGGTSEKYGTIPFISIREGVIKVCEYIIM